MSWKARLRRGFKGESKKEEGRTYSDLVESASLLNASGLLYSLHFFLFVAQLHFLICKSSINK